MRRHYSQYFKGLDHFKEYRTKLVTSHNKEEILATLEEVIEKYSKMMQVA